MMILIVMFMQSEDGGVRGKMLKMLKNKTENSYELVT